MSHQDTINANLAIFLSHKKKNSKLSKQAITDLDRLIHSIKAGQCFGLSICWSALQYIEKPLWWDAALRAVETWDRTEKSLQQNLKLSQAESASTLHDIFERVLNYTAYDHYGTFIQSLLDSSPTFPQQIFLDPKRNFFSIEKHTVTHRKIIAGNFTSNEISYLLDEKTIANSICLLHDGEHTISTAFKNSYWLLYDSNFDFDDKNKTYSKKFTDKKKLIAEITRLLGSSIAIEVASLENLSDKEANQKFNNFTEIRNKLSLKHLKKFGLAVCATFCPDDLYNLLNSLHPDEYKEIAPLLTKKNEVNPSVHSAFHLMAMCSPNSFIRLVHYALIEKQRSNSQLLTSIAKALLLAERGWTPIHLLAQQSPKFVFMLIEEIITNDLKK